MGQAHARWLLAIRRGLAPVTVGLILSSGFFLASAADIGWTSLALTCATVLLLLCTGFNPLWLILAGALFGLLN